MASHGLLSLCTFFLKDCSWQCITWWCITWGRYLQFLNQNQRVIHEWTYARWFVEEAHSYFCFYFCICIRWFSDVGLVMNLSPMNSKPSFSMDTIQIYICQTIPKQTACLGSETFPSGWWMHFLEQSPPVFKRSGVGFGIEDYKNKSVLFVCGGGGGDLRSRIMINMLQVLTKT